MRLLTIFTTLTSISLASATSVLLPLYIWPSDSSWAPVYNAVSAHPSVTFLVIVNPGDGPGAGSMSASSPRKLSTMVSLIAMEFKGRVADLATAYPESDYISAVAKLNSYSNVKTIGYVSRSAC